MNQSMEEAIVDAERALLDPAIRRDRMALERWLDPEFTEIGQSGTLWGREAIIEDLVSRDQVGFAVSTMTEMRVTVLAEGCFLLTYVVRIEDRQSRRSSIWRFDGRQPRMVFHQGTLLALRSQAIS